MRTTHIYLSPHLDDAVLSCGGVIHHQCARGERVVVLTVFAGKPPAPVHSPVVEQLHSRWEAGAEPVVARRSEDRQALALLGAQAVHLRHLDCPYRLGPDGKSLYPTTLSIFGPRHPADAVTVGDLASELDLLCRSHAATRLYAPLAAGHHVDHRLVREAALARGHHGVLTALYEDYPYAESGSTVDTALLDLPGWESELVQLSEADVTAKVAAIACYRSQISSFWQDGAEMGRRVREYARAVGSGRPAERVWHVAAGTLGAPNPRTAMVCAKRSESPNASG